MLNHGGQLLSAVKKYGGEKSSWLDLSTGINPCGWPVPGIPVNVFQRLPEAYDGLEEAAMAYYRNTSLLAIPGSQSVIQLLPKLRTQSRVLLPELGYGEHEYHWRQQRHKISLYQTDQIEKALQNTDVLVVINPNNPTGEFISTEQLLHWHQQLAKKGGWLIVDEAFMDAYEDNSLVSYSGCKGLIVLRSVGKFFGLAGIRSGFVFAEDSLLKQIESQLGPWAVSNVARYITKLALSDKDWQGQMKDQLKKESEKLQSCLLKTFNTSTQGCYLFQTLMDCRAEKIREYLAQQRVLVRLLDNYQGLRFGLPLPSQWPRLEKAFKQIKGRI